MIAAARSAGDVTGAAVAQVHALDPSRPVYAVRPMDDAVARLLAPGRLQTLLMAGFAAAALVLAVVGVYDMLLNDVARRARELGVRTALGAGRREIVLLCLRRGLVRIGLRFGLGLGAALAGTRLLSGELFGLEPWDPVTYAAALVVVIAAGVAATLVPAVRAGRADPVAARRRE